MKNPINKSNIRRPLKGILLIIILLVASNLFISSISQFFIVNREVDNIGKYYRSIGTIRPLDENNKDITEARKLIADDPMIDFEDIRRTTTGIIDELYRNKRKDNAFVSSTGSNVDDLIFIGEIIEARKARDAASIYEGSFLSVNLVEQLAGIPDFIESDTYYEMHEEVHFVFDSHSIVTGEKLEYINDDIIDEIYAMEPGKKYLFRSYVYGPIKASSFAKPLYEGGPLYIELDDSGDIDWEDPQFKIIKEEMDFINENIISYHLTSTRDMTAMAEVQDSSKDYYLVEGRWINKEDDKNKNHVVIIHETIAKNYEINIGDRLDIKMRDSDSGAFTGLLASEKDHKEWKTYYTSEPTSFEVVGIFNRSGFAGAGSYFLMYIPESTMSMELGRYTIELDELVPMYTHLYAFVLKNAEDESAFIEKYNEPLKKMGYEFSFLLKNAESFLESSQPMKRSTTISTVLFTVLLILIQGFVVYIYIDGHKLNYAIERALGIPPRVSGRHLIQPLIIYGIIASVVGGYMGYDNAINKSTELLGKLPPTTFTTVNSELDIKYLILFVIVSMIPFAAMLAIRINKLKKSSVIDLINNNKRKKAVNGKREKLEMTKVTNISTISTEIEVDTKEIEEDIRKDNNGLVKKDSGKSSKKALKRFSLNYTLRSKVTSILLIVLAGIFTFSLLWINYLTIKNKELIESAYKNYTITGNILTEGSLFYVTGTGPINKKHIDNLLETDLVEDYTATAFMKYDELYRDRDGVIEKYEMGEKDKIHYHIAVPTFPVRASNKAYNSPDGVMEFTELKMIDGYSLEDFHKEYTTGHSKNYDTVIVYENGEEGFPILVSNKAMEHYNLELGDKIFLKPDTRFRRLPIEVYGTVAGTFKEYSKGRDHYGYSGTIEDELFIYPLSVLETFEIAVYYEEIDFVFKQEKNKEFMERKEEIRGIVADNPGSELPTELKVWDGEITNVVEPLEKNISLLEILYPVTFVLSMLIAGIFTFIMVLRRSVDVAILRILGVKGKEVRWNLFRENLILVVLGIGVSCIVIIIISAKTYPIGIDKYVMVIGGYLLGTIAGLILGIGKVTNKKPLEMLQVKE